MKELQHLNKYFYKYKWRLILGFLITIAARIFAIYPVQFIGDSTNVIESYVSGEIGSATTLRQELFYYILLIIGAQLISAFLTFLMRQTFIVVSRYMEFDLKNEVYEQYQKLSLSFYKKNRTGDLMNRISEDVSKVRMYLGPAIMYSVTTLTLFVIVIWYMVNTAPMLTLYTLAPLPFLSYAIYKLSVAIHKRSTVVQQYLSTVTSQKKRSPHVLRHSFAIHLMDEGADLNAVKDLLGHANLSATQIYTHNSIEKLKNIYKFAHPKSQKKI